MENLRQDDHLSEHPRTQTLRRRIDATEVRRTILEQSRRVDMGHIGSCLSVVEILCAIYETLRIEGRHQSDRDRFVLSKGHAALALYATLVEAGVLEKSSLDMFCQDGSHVGVHPERGLRGIDFSTGSLGHGLSMACGAAFAARAQHSDRRVYCLISDAECNEGSVWEAAMFAAHHKLAQLTTIVDINGQQALGLTRDVLDISNMQERWRAFGWRTVELDGHSAVELRAAIQDCAKELMQPTMILARTKMGRGVPFMEQGRSISRTALPVNPVNWHYLPMTEQEYQLAMTALEEVVSA